MSKVESPAIITSKTRAMYGKDLFREHDKGSARPAFCYPSSIQTLREDTGRLEKLINSRMVEPTKEPELRVRLKQLKTRLSAIDKQITEVKKEIKANPDHWDGRRKDLIKLIQEYSPSKNDRTKKKVSAYDVLRREKGAKGKLPPLEHGGDSMTLSEAKKEFMIISRAMDEESSISIIEKD